MVQQTLKIGTIFLSWSCWYPWEALKVDGRTKKGIKIPNKRPGVYEVRYKSSQRRLTIGKASDLRFRIRQALIKGKGKHSSGDDIRALENVKRIVVRWARTSRPSAAEEELHRLYVKKYGKLPKHTDRT